MLDLLGPGANDLLFRLAESFELWNYSEQEELAAVARSEYGEKSLLRYSQAQHELLPMTGWFDVPFPEFPDPPAWPAWAVDVGPPRYWQNVFGVMLGSFYVTIYEYTPWSAYPFIRDWTHPLYGRPRKLDDAVPVWRRRYIRDQSILFDQLRGVFTPARLEELEHDLLYAGIPEMLYSERQAAAGVVESFVAGGPVLVDGYEVFYDRAWFLSNITRMVRFAIARQVYYEPTLHA